MDTKREGENGKGCHSNHGKTGETTGGLGGNGGKGKYSGKTGEGSSLAATRRRRRISLGTGVFKLNGTKGGNIGEKYCSGGSMESYKKDWGKRGK